MIFPFRRRRPIASVTPLPTSNVRRLPGLDECVACNADLRPGDALLCASCAWESRRDGSRR